MQELSNHETIKLSLSKILSQHCQCCSSQRLDERTAVDLARALRGSVLEALANPPGLLNYGNQRVCVPQHLILVGPYND